MAFREEDIANEVNGPLLEILVQAVNYHDVKCPELFRSGAPLALSLTHPSQLSECFVCAQFTGG